MRYIRTSNGFDVAVDDEDYDLVSRHTWRAIPYRKTYYANMSVVFNVGAVRISSTVKMHRFILGVSRLTQIDHADMNGLNNVKSNLRFCTVGQNRANTNPPITNRSGYKGVHRTKYSWVANCAGEYIGSFRDKEQAALAYDRAARARYGEFARTNFDPAKSRTRGL